MNKADAERTAKALHAEALAAGLHWAARCECRNGHNSSSGRCNARHWAGYYGANGAPAKCDDCVANCGGAK